MMGAPLPKDGEPFFRMMGAPFPGDGAPRRADPPCKGRRAPPGGSPFKWGEPRRAYHPSPIPPGRGSLLLGTGAPGPRERASRHWGEGPPTLGKDALAPRERARLHRGSGSLPGALECSVPRERPPLPREWGPRPSGRGPRPSGKVHTSFGN